MIISALSGCQLEELESILGHPLSNGERVHYDTHHSDEYGYFLMDGSPLAGRKRLLLYTGCWGRGILHYLDNHRKDLRAEYSVLIILDYALVLSVIRDKKFHTPEIVKAAWQTADAIIFTPIGSGYGDFSSEYLLKFVKPECKTAAFTGPNQGCWWPVCPVIGEQGVIELRKQGLNEDQIYARFLNGTFDPRFHDRFIEQRAFLKGKQSFGSVKLAEFLERHYLTHKMFFTANHPTFNVVAYIADCCFGLMGHPVVGEEHALSLPLDAHMVGGVYPETHYEWDHYGFKYPMRYAKSWGGAEQFYREAIHDAVNRQINK